MSSSLARKLLGSSILALGILVSADAAAWHGGGGWHGGGWHGGGGGWHGGGWHRGGGWYGGGAGFGYGGWGPGFGWGGLGWGGPGIILAPTVGYYGTTYYGARHCRWIPAHRNVRGVLIGGRRVCW